MRLLHRLALNGALAALAANADQGSQPISAPDGGQIALTAHNDGDGTWSVTRGPGGAVLRSGLPREKALAIVGGATVSYEPQNEQEQTAADERKTVEAEAAKVEEAEMLKSDEDLKADPLDHDRNGNGNGKKGGSVASNVKAVGNAGDGGAKEKNGGE